MDFLERLPLVSQLLTLEFREPLLLWLSPIAVLAFFIARNSFGSVRFSSLSILPKARHTWRTRLQWMPDFLVAAAVAALVIALAGPRSTDAKSKIRTEGIAIMMILDTSGSMRALDLSDDKQEKTRLEAVREVFHDFVHGSGELHGRPNDAIGLISFARYADTRSPLTLDHDNLSAIVDDLEIVKERNEDGTAIGDGLGLAIERLRKSKAKSRIAILLTDGVNNSGEETPVGAAQLAEAVDVKVYTIGAGSNGMAPVRVENPFTGQPELRQVAVQIDEETLREVAERTGGRYFRATDGAGLREVYAEIDRLERTELTEDRYREYKEKYQLAIAIALLLAILSWILRASLFRRIPC